MTTTTVANKPAPIEAAEALAQVLDSKLTRNGVDLATLSLVSPILLVFVRHSGCVFCREALSDLAESRDSIERTGTRIVVVYMGGEEAMNAMLEHYGLTSLDRIHDTDQSLYRAFGLKEGSWWQLAGPRVWFRGLSASLIGGHKVGRPAGDIRQMPGMFLLDQCELVKGFRHSNASDRPLYDSFVRAGLNS